MLGFILKRFGYAVIVALIVVSVVFFANRTIGDPAMMILGPTASPEALDRVRDNLGLNDTQLVQYGRFLANLIQGDFGDTYRFGFSRASSVGAEQEGIPVLPIVLERIPATIYLATTAMFIALVLAVPMGIIAAMHPRSFVDRFVNVLSLAGVSIVEFWLAMMLILSLSVWLGVLPTSGYGGAEFVLLPALTLAFRPMGRVAQLTRSSMLDELAKPYVRTARAKGFTETRIALVHALRNASLPILTMIGDETANVLTGVIIVEMIFAWPGLGALTLDALSRRDLPLVEATIFVLAGIVILVNLTVDILYQVLNPSSNKR
jgi:peptide/nickel transport system permease protein